MCQGINRRVLRAHNEIERPRNEGESRAEGGLEDPSSLGRNIVIAPATLARVSSRTVPVSLCRDARKNNV